MAQSLRALAAPAEDLSSTPTTHVMFTNNCNSGPRDPTPSSDLTGYCVHTAHIHTFRQNTNKR